MKFEEKKVFCSFQTMRRTAAPYFTFTSPTYKLNKKTQNEDQNPLPYAKSHVYSGQSWLLLKMIGASGVLLSGLSYLSDMAVQN